MGYNPWGHKQSDTTEQLQVNLLVLAGPLASELGCPLNVI